MRRLPLVLRLSMCALTVLALSGCWPVKFNYRTAVTGTVVSSTDGKPVANAAISLTVPRSDLVPQTIVHTASDGSFSMPPYYRWGVASAIGETWEVPGSIQIVAPGYAAYRRELHWKQTTRKPQQLGVIKLDPAAQ